MSYASVLLFCKGTQNFPIFTHSKYFGFQEVWVLPFNYEFYTRIGTSFFKISVIESRTSPYRLYLIVATTWQAEVTQRFGRAINFQIRTKLSAGVHPRLRETARWAQAFFCFMYCHKVYQVLDQHIHNVHKVPLHEWHRFHIYYSLLAVHQRL